LRDCGVGCLRDTEQFLIEVVADAGACQHEGDTACGVDGTSPGEVLVNGDGNTIGAGDDADMSKSRKKL
jgi:hypothetical protein